MSRLNVTHTYALLEVSAAAYDEIAAKLREAGYDHVFGGDGEIDMHGIALTRAAPPAAPVDDHDHHRLADDGCPHHPDGRQ